MTEIATYKPENLTQVDSSKRQLHAWVISHQPLIRAFRGDCMDLMQATADNHYDLAIVDPPYGKDAGNMTMGKGKNKKYSNSDWDKYKPDNKYFAELRRVSKNQIIWGGNYFNLPFTDAWIVWDKCRFKNISFADCELAWTSLQNQMKIARIKYDGFLGADEVRIHKCQKPVALYRWLLQNYAKAGQRILDTHGGSFSSAVACHTEGFEMDIVEIDQEYFDAGVKRFKEATCQLKIF